MFKTRFKCVFVNVFKTRFKHNLVITCELIFIDLFKKRLKTLRQTKRLKRVLNANLQPTTSNQQNLLIITCNY